MGTRPPVAGWSANDPVNAPPVPNLTDSVRPRDGIAGNADREERERNPSGLREAPGRRTALSIHPTRPQLRGDLEDGLQLRLDAFGL